MIRAVPLFVAAALCAPGASLAQTIRFSLDGISLTYQEVREGRSSTGQGTGAGLELRIGRFRLDARGYHADVTPDYDSRNGPVNIVGLVRRPRRRIDRSRSRRGEILG